jgi:spermidine synthase
MAARAGERVLGRWRMVPRELVDTATVPGGGLLRLYRRGGEFTITLDGAELMSSRAGGSEEALAAMSCRRLEAARPHLLIGGYGMGFTLRAALAALGGEARITVAELVPSVIQWARGPMAALSAGCLDDPRVDVVIDDVAAVIGRSSGAYDAILLDVDNGPDGLTRDRNDRLYSAAGLAAARTALTPLGILAVWSASPDRAFLRRMREAGLDVDEVGVRERSSNKGARHVIYVGRRS